MGDSQTVNQVTIRDLAEACGVGVTTVWRALNDQRDVSEETRRRVKEAARRLNYHPNPHAQKLRVTTTNSVAVLVKGPQNPFFLSLLDSLETQIRQAGHSMTLVRVPHDADEVQVAHETCGLHKPAGIIFLGGWFNQSHGQLQSLPIPHVLCTVPVIGGETMEKTSSVAIDDAQGISLLIEHLLELGHSRIAFLGPDPADRSVGAIRQRAFNEALNRAGITPDENLIVAGDLILNPYSLEYGYQLTRQLLSRKTQFTALAAMTDVMAVGAMRALREAGIMPGHEVSLTGFDGLELTRYVYPTLTTVVQPVAELAQAATSLLFGQLSGTNPPQQLLIAPQLRLGESTRPRSCEAQATQMNTV